MENIGNLRDYLRKEWKHNNISKYQKYFDMWFNNLTDNQIYYYNLYMENS